MSAQRQETVRRVTASDVTARKGKAPIVCLTAYTAPMAQVLDDHCDLLLVGDSVGMVVHGLPNTVGVTLEMMIMHGQAVMRGARKAMVVVDMPFGSYEGDCQKLESGPTVPETIAYLVRRGIPVMGHVGLRPQSVLVDGGFRAKGRTNAERAAVIDEAKATAAAGAFAIVVEGVAESLATAVTAEVEVPTIGIGASSACDGQILVVDDMLGLFDWTPKFVRRYADLRGEIGRAAKAYADDVRERRFPASAETYFSKAAE
jgi:3-methyl-2-oxobutanoate hydroxymethyltransferase